MKTPKPPGGGGNNEDFWTWVVFFIVTHIAAMGAGIAWGEAGKEREFRELIRKQREEKENGNQR